MTRLGLLGIAAAVPLGFSGSLDDGTALPKLLLFALSACALAWGAAFKKKGPESLRTPLDLPLLALSLVLLLSAALSVDPWVSLLGQHRVRVWGLLQAALCAAAFYAARWGAEPSDGRLFLRACLAAGALVGLHALLQRAGVEPLPGFPAVSQGRPYSTLATPVLLGAWLLMLPAPALHLMRSEERADRALAWAGLPLIAAALFLTQSRAAWLGAAAAAAAYLVLGSKERRPSPKTLLLAGALLLGAVAAVSFLRKTSFVDAARWELWKTGWRAFLEHPWLGSGPDTFLWAYRAHKTARLYELMGAFRSQSFAHNDLVQALSTTGLLGAAACLWLVWAAALGAWRALGEGEERSLRAALAASLLGLFVQLKFDPCSIASLALASVFAGLLFAAPPVPVGRRAAPFSAVLLCALGVLAAGALCRADAFYRRWRVASASGRPAEALAHLERAARADPYELQYRWDLSIALFNASDAAGGAEEKLRLVREAAAEADEAARLHPLDARALELKGYTRIWLARLTGPEPLAEAERLLDQAQALDPTYPPVMKARLQLARRRKDAGKASSLGERLKTLSAEPAYGSY
ncbi:MAG TPA: hypothetical protein DCM05_14620 [Elusimicrobia bacterium]|nr:hypothetical protein [Elusimicrobiota bacterium]